MALDHLPLPGRHPVESMPPAADPPVYTINEFCKAHRISRSQLYAEWKANRGPRFFLVGSHRRITGSAAADWRYQSEADTANGR